jgi:hypothetical protein
LVSVTSERRQVGPLNEAGAGTHAHLIDDGVITESNRDAAVVGDATGVSLIAWNAPAVSIGAIVNSQEVTASWDHSSGRDG